MQFLLACNSSANWVDVFSLEVDTASVIVETISIALSKVTGRGGGEYNQSLNQ